MAWADAIERRDGPTVLALTRQALPAQPRTAEQVAAIRRGGYVLKDCEGTPEVDPDRDRLGSRRSPSRRRRLLQQKGRRVRVVSMPCTNVFDAQDESYRERVLPRRSNVASPSKRPRRRRGGATSGRAAPSSA